MRMMRMMKIPVQGDHNHEEPGGVQAQHPGTQQSPIVEIFLSQLYVFPFAFIAWNLILETTFNLEISLDIKIVL